MTQVSKWTYKLALNDSWNIPPPHPHVPGRSSVMAESAVISAAGAPDAAEVPEVDASQPSTTLQIRLHDGRRVRAQLNMSHTVRHIQAIIARCWCHRAREGKGMGMLVFRVRGWGGGGGLCGSL